MNILFIDLRVCHIQTIEMKPNKYYINIMSNKFQGFNSNFPAVGFGHIS
jgi:hypothetical protein